MYESFYGFDEKPFMLTPDPRYLYLSRSHRDALNHLRYGLTEGEGFIVIAGEVGVGKTTTCRALLEQIPDMMRTALIVNPLVSEIELLETILEEFGAIPKQTKPSTPRTIKECHDLLNQYLLDLASRGERGVLIIDEAQNLSLSSLERIRLLSNLETEKSKLLQIILVGQVELLKKLARPELAQLNQRISVRYALMSLDQEEMTGYINHRLKIGGAKTPITFLPDALAAIFKFSRGLPRLINLASDRALLAGFEEESTTITGQMVSRGIKSLEGSDPFLNPQRRVSRTVVTGTLVILFVSGMLGALVMFQGPLHQILSPTLEVLKDSVSLGGIRIVEQHDAPPLQEAPVKPVHPTPPRPQVTEEPEFLPADEKPSSISPPETHSPSSSGPLPQHFIALETFNEPSVAVAQQRVRQLISLGYQASLGTFITADQKTRYAIFVSGFTSNEAMDSTLNELRSIAEFSKAQRISIE